LAEQNFPSVCPSHSTFAISFRGNSGWSTPCLTFPSQTEFQFYSINTNSNKFSSLLLTGGAPMVSRGNVQGALQTSLASSISIVEILATSTTSIVTSIGGGRVPGPARTRTVQWGGVRGGDAARGPVGPHVGLS
jgi:hypothetical protein